MLWTRRLGRYRAGVTPPRLTALIIVGATFLRIDVEKLRRLAVALAALMLLSALAAAASPDGRRIAFVTQSASGERALWVRSLQSPLPQRIEGTEGAAGPFWSPDGRFVGFFALGEKKLEKIDTNDYKLQGDLTIKGITKPVTLDIEFGGIMKDPWGNEKAGLAVNGKINRKG